MDRVLAQTIVGKSFNKKLVALNLKNLKELQKTENELKKNDNALQAQKNVLENDEYQKKLNTLRNDFQKYQISKTDRIKNTNKQKIDFTNKFLKLINPIIAAYSKENSISIIFQKKYIVIGKTELDITNNIISIIDRKIKKIDLK